MVPYHCTKCKGKMVDSRTMKKHELKKKLIPTLRGINENLGQVLSQDNRIEIDTSSSSNEEIEPIEPIEPKLLSFDQEKNYSFLAKKLSKD